MRGRCFYSRFGYGQSDGLVAERTRRFMHEEGLDVLPELLDQFQIERPLLVGHSDGASIALIHAAAAGRPVAGLVLMAPHVFVEPCDRREHRPHPRDLSHHRPQDRLAKYHAHVDDAFLGWADTWLRPEFLAWSIEELVADVDRPMLLIQGRDDEYGTLEQLDRIAARAHGPVSRLVLEQCGHSPHRDQEAAVLEAIVDFARNLST